MALPLLLALLCNTHAHSAQSQRDNPRASMDFYVQTYGRVSATELPQVYKVFEKVRAAADKNILLTPQLVIVRDTKQASAFTLSDGTIVLSTKALGIIQQNLTDAESDARLAFVLGHELAHLAANDFWDNQVSQALLESSTAKELPKIELRIWGDASSDQQKKELRADDLGFMYAALAGFDVDSILETSRGNEDFLSFWNSQVGRRNDPNYPLPGQRSGLLRLRLAELRNATNYFSFGVRLMHFGRYREALDFYTEFRKHFPGRELFNNLGYCHLRLALNELDPELAYKYWLPMLPEVDSPLAHLNPRASVPSKNGVNARVREHLLQAAQNFEMAVEKDQTYAPGFINLTISYLLLGMYGEGKPVSTSNYLLRAKLAIGSALNLKAADTHVLMLGAIVDYELQSADKKENRVPRLASFAASDVEDPMYLYNSFQLSREDSVRSARLMKKLFAQFDGLPASIQAAVCRRVDTVSLDEQQSRCTARVRSKAMSAPPLDSPLSLSRDLLDKPLTSSELGSQGWQSINLKTGTVYAGKQSSMLAIDDIAVMAVMKNPALTVDALAQNYGQPIDKVPVVNGMIWHYGRWIALVRERAVEEVWISN